MKKTILIVLVILVLGISYLASSSYYIIKGTDVSILNKCHTTKMNKVFLCPGSGSYTPLNGVSKHFKSLIVIAEDSSFFSHKGFDWHEIKESFKQNLKALSYLRGGSTITQQLVKNVFLEPTKSLRRKFIEAMLATKIESKFSKNKILERYINVIEFGKGIFGITKASRHYFAKSPSQLTELESAFLVYLVPSPVKYSRVFYDKQLTSWSKKRIKTLLRKLKNFKKISESRYEFLITKIDEFPWKGTSLVAPASESNLDLETTEKPIIDEPNEEELQNEVSEEIQKELNEENELIK